MGKREKIVITTMGGGDKRAAVEAMHDLLERLRELPEWGNRENGLIIRFDDGREAEVTQQTGAREAFLIEIRPVPEN